MSFDTSYTPGGGSGSLVSLYAARSHIEQEREAERQQANQANQTNQPNQRNQPNQIKQTPIREYPITLPTQAGVPHSTLNLTHGIVVDPAAKKLGKFENEKYLRSHPELGILVQDFIVHVLETRPASIEEAAIEFFVREGTKRSEDETPKAES